MNARLPSRVDSNQNGFFPASLAQLREIYGPHAAKFESRSLWNFITNISRPNRAEKSYERACISAFTTYTDA